MREAQAPTTDERGSETHPAFARISAARTSSSPPGQVLFDSDVRHQHTVRVTIETASRKRDNNHDYIHGGQQLIEVEMSEAQWASFVSSMNTTGVPCTLRATQSEYRVPGLPYQPRLAISMAEVRGAADRVMSEIRQARDAYEAALAVKAPAKEIKELRSKLHYAIENAESSMTFAAESLNKHSENVVQRARADIEAMALQQAQTLQLEAGSVTLPELPGGAA